MEEYDGFYRRKSFVRLCGTLGFWEGLGGPYIC